MGVANHSACLAPVCTRGLQETPCHTAHSRPEESSHVIVTVLRTTKVVIYRNGSPALCTSSFVTLPHLDL